MTSASLWVEGARPRTLGAAVAPVLVGTSAAVADADGVIWWRFAAALVVALALQVGVNYANDYSDGVRGTDRDRKGPLRLTATGTATPHAVRNAAALAFGVAAVVGPRAVARRRTRGCCSSASPPSPPPCSTPAARSRYGYLGLGEVHGARVLRVRRDRRLRVRAGRAGARRGVVGLARRRAARVRDPPRQQRPRHPDRRASRASARSRCGSARRHRARLFVACYVGSFARVVVDRRSRNRGRCSGCSRCRSRWRRCASCSRAPIRRRWSPRWWRRRSSRWCVAVLVSVGLCLS